MVNHHFNHRGHHETSTQKEAGFLSFNFKKFMSKKDKFLILGISLGVVALFAASMYLMLSNRSADVAEEDTEMQQALIAQEKLNKELDAKIAEVKDVTVIINPRAIIPDSVNIKKGGSVGFFNETSDPVTIEAYDGASEILNIGEVEPFDIPVVVFEKAGTYKYINPQNPQDVAEIVVTE